MFPPEVLKQAQADAEAARRANPERNAFQRAQDFLRNKLNKFLNKPQTPAVTSEQQVKADAEVGRRAQQKFDSSKGKPKPTKASIPALGKLGTALSTGAAIGSWMEDNLEQNVSVSGRGAGRSAFRDSNRGGASNQRTPATVSSGWSTDKEGLDKILKDVPSGGQSTGWQTTAEDLDAVLGPRNMSDKTELERYGVWARAHKGLAEKVKPGQAGYEEIQATLKSMETGLPAEDLLGAVDHSWNAPAEQMEPGAISTPGWTWDDLAFDNQHELAANKDPQEFAKRKIQSLSSTLTTPLTTANLQDPEAGSSPVPDIADSVRAIRMERENLTVPMSQIPSSKASPKEWETYFSNLDSGKLTK